MDERTEDGQMTALFEVLEPSSEVKARLEARVLIELPTIEGTLASEWVGLVKARPVANSALILAAAVMLAAVLFSSLPLGFLGTVVAAKQRQSAPLSAVDKAPQTLIARAQSAVGGSDASEHDPLF